MSRFVTPSLYLGQPDLPNTEQVDTAQDAIEAIESGHIAVLPDGDAALVEPILRALGVDDEEHLSGRVHIAQHGNLPQSA